MRSASAGDCSHQARVAPGSADESSADESSADEGSVMILILGVTVVLAMLVAVVVDTGRLYLTRRSLDAVTDGAALAGSQAVDLDAVYAGTAAADLPLDEAAARRAVRRYLDRADAADRLHGFELSVVAVDGETVTVTTRSTVNLPFVGPFTHGRSTAVVRSTASARNHLVP